MAKKNSNYQQRYSCGIPAIDDLLGKAWDNIPEGEQLDVATRVRDLIRRYQSMSPNSADLNTVSDAKAKAAANFNFIMRTAAGMNASPNSQRNMGYYLSYLFGLEQNVLGLGDDFTDAGRISNALNTVRRAGQGTVHERLSRIQFIDDALRADKVFEEIRRNHRISRTDWNILKLDAYEVGWHPYAQKEYGLVNTPSIQFLRDRQVRFHDKLKELGVTQGEARRMARSVQQVVDNYNAALETLQNFGIKMGEGGRGMINYLPRNFSTETRRRIGWSRNQDRFETFGLDGAETLSVGSVMSKSRESFHYVPEDSMILDLLLTEAVPDIYMKMGVQGIDDLLADGVLSRVFVEYIDRVNPRMFDAMVDNGLVSKVPMTTTELFEYMKVRYELPFGNIDEFHGTDFAEMSAVYKNQAERLAGRSIMTHFTAKAAVEGGWGVTAAERAADPMYASYIRLTSPQPGNENVVIRTAEAERLGIDALDNAEVYVHPIVAELYRAQIDIFTDPNQMGIIARIADDFSTTFQQMSLATSGFVFRQMYAPFMQIWAGGGRLDVYANVLGRATAQIGKLKGAGLSLDTFDEAFDNGIKRYLFVDETTGKEEMFTMREMWRMMRQAGEVEEMMPFMGESVRSTGYNPTAKGVNIGGVQIPMSGVAQGLWRQKQYLSDVMHSHKLTGGDKVAEMYRTLNTGWRRVSSQAFFTFAATNVLFDNMGRFALLLSLTDTSDINRVIRMAQGNFKNGGGAVDFNNAMRRVNNYFFRYDNAGKLDEWMRHIRPFWMFTSRNNFSIFRMMVREPGKFMAYQRLFAALNAPDGEDESNPLPMGAIPDYVNNTAPLMWIIRDDKGNPRQVFTLPRAQFDNIASGTEEVTSGLDAVLDHFGMWPGRRRNISDVYQDLPWAERSTNRFLRSWAQDSYGHIQALFTLTTGQDPYTGRMVRVNETGLVESNLLGMEVTPLQKTVIEQLFPLARNVNRSNPGGLFGTPPRFDGEGNLLEPGKPSWADVPRQPNSADFRVWWQRTASALGFNIYKFDVLEQLGYRQAEVQVYIRDGYKALGQKRQQILGMTDPQEINLEIEKLRMMEALQAALVIDYVNLINWGQERGLNYNGAVGYMRRNNLQQYNLQSLDIETQDILLQSVYGENLLGGPQVQSEVPQMFAEPTPPPTE